MVYQFKVIYKYNHSNANSQIFSLIHSSEMIGLLLSIGRFT